MGDYSGEPLVDKPYRNGRYPDRERFSKVSCQVSGLSSLSGKASGQTYDNLDYTPVICQRGNLIQVAPAAGSVPEVELNVGWCQ